MKAINYLLFMLLIVCSSSCTNNEKSVDVPSGNNQKNTAIATPLTIATITQYDIDSTLKEVYEIDENTKQKNGWFRRYDNQNILLWECQYKADKAEGIEKEYYASGQLQGEFLLKNGKYNGPFKYYFEDGEIKQEGKYVNDQMEGLLKTYYNNGQLKDEVTFIAGMTKGTFKEYNKNGTIKTEGTYNHKKERGELETGELLQYDENGVLLTRRLCKDGTCCAIWTKKEGDVQPNNDYCANVIKSVKASMATSSEKEKE